jgi:hypothetical protein
VRVYVDDANVSNKHDVLKALGRHRGARRRPSGRWSDAMPQLLTNASATGTAQVWPGGTGAFECTAAAWNTGTVSLQRLAQDGAWHDVSTDTVIGSGTATSVGFMMPPGQIRAAVTGAPTNVNASAWKVRP